MASFLPVNSLVAAAAAAGSLLSTPSPASTNRRQSCLERTGPLHVGGPHDSSHRDRLFPDSLRPRKEPDKAVWGSLDYNGQSVRKPFVSSPNSDSACNMDKEVKIRICFLLIGDIDTKAQRFVAEALIEATWEGAEDEGHRFDPKLVITNIEETRKETRWYTSSFDGLTGLNWVTMHWRIKGVFYENMELENFPRDVQDISISVSSDWHANEIELMLDEGKMSTLDVANFQDDQEWSLFKHVELERVPEDPDSDIELGYTAGFVIARCRVARRAKFFMVNNVIVMFSLILLSLTIFSYDPFYNMMRISSNMTLLLVAVAFKLSVSSNLPLISYLTYLDMYILGGMLYLCLMCFVFAIISQWKEDPHVSANIDRVAFATLTVLITVSHVVYAVVFIANTNRRRNEMRQKDRIYERDLERYNLRRHKIPPSHDNSLDLIPARRGNGDGIVCRVGDKRLAEKYPIRAEDGNYPIRREDSTGSEFLNKFIDHIPNDLDGYTASNV